MASAKATIDHGEIQRWVAERGGFPAHVKRTGDDGDPGLLRIDYPGYSGAESLERVSWEEWFHWFDGDKLAFLYQDERDSRFSRLVSRDTVDVSGGAGKTSRDGSIVSRVTGVIRGRSSAKQSDGTAKKASSRRGASSKAGASRASLRKAASARAGAASRKRSTSQKAASRKSGDTARRASSSKTASAKGKASRRRR